MTGDSHCVKFLKSNLTNRVGSKTNFPLFFPNQFLKKSLGNHSALGNIPSDPIMPSSCPRSVFSRSRIGKSPVPEFPYLQSCLFFWGYSLCLTPMKCNSHTREEWQIKPPTLSNMFGKLRLLFCGIKNRSLRDKDQTRSRGILRQGAGLRESGSRRTMVLEGQVAGFQDSQPCCSRTWAQRRILEKGFYCPSGSPKRTEWQDCKE